MSLINFQREHKLCCGVTGSVMSRGESGGERRLHLREQDHPEIDLAANISVTMLLIGARIRSQTASEDCEPGPVEIEFRRSEIAEMYWGQVPFDQRFQKAPSADLIDLGAGEAVVLAIAADLAFVDPVVAEGAEVEVSERVILVAPRVACG